MQLLRKCQGKKLRAPVKAVQRHTVRKQAAAASEFAELLCEFERLMYSHSMKLFSRVLVFFPVFIGICAAQTPAPQAPDYSGMYSFLKDGEFMQITIEDKGAVSGFISRYGESDADKGTFLDQFIKAGKLDGKHLSFTTESVHGITFTFEGDFDSGPAKKAEDEGYYVLRGTLTRNSSGGNASGQTRQVEFKSFPRDADTAK